MPNSFNLSQSQGKASKIPIYAWQKFRRSYSEIFPYLITPCKNLLISVKVKRKTSKTPVFPRWKLTNASWHEIFRVYIPWKFSEAVLQGMMLEEKKRKKENYSRPPQGWKNIIPSATQSVSETVRRPILCWERMNETANTLKIQSEKKRPKTSNPNPKGLVSKGRIKPS